MSHNKAIKHGKERRRPYRGSRRFDHSCRNHGGCGYCRGNRLYAAVRRVVAADERLKDATLPELSALKSAPVTDSDEMPMNSGN
jgi:hypothetical protein